MKSKTAAIRNRIRIVHSTSIASRTAPALAGAARGLIPAVNSRVSPLLIAPSGWFRLPNVPRHSSLKAAKEEGEDSKAHKEEMDKFVRPGP